MPKARRTLELLAELAAPRARLLYTMRDLGVTLILLLKQ